MIRLMVNVLCPRGNCRTLATAISFAVPGVYVLEIDTISRRAPMPSTIVTV
jgi:hypothetical protein